MNALCRPCLCALFVSGCISLTGADEKPSPTRTEYDQWLQPYAAKSSTGWFPGPGGAAKNVQVPLKLLVTAIERDQPQANAQDYLSNRQFSYGCRVAADGRVQHFYYGPMGAKGGGYPIIPDADRKRLDQLLSKLPDDGARLPPPGRRLVLQVPEGDHFRTLVYDRANAPDEVWEILHISYISLCGIRSWVPEFKSESDLNLGAHEFDGILALTPDGQLVSAVMHGQLRFWDPATHKELKELPLPDRMVPQGVKFSPNGSLAVLTGWGQSNCCVMDANTGKVLRDFQEPIIGRYGGKLYFPQFTADGRFLLFLCSQPDADGHRTILPRVYDARTWEKRDKLPGLPDNALTCIEAPKSKRAVVLLKDNVVALWDFERHREYAKLDADLQIHEVAFSPDESMVALATEHRLEGKRWPFYRIRVWNMDTGKLVHELRPFEQDTCEKVVGLQWTADGEYILAATKAHPMFDNCDINVWNVRSGRQRGNLSDGLLHPMGVVMLPDGCHVAAGGTGHEGSVIRFWDFAAALKQIRAFENSLAKPSAKK